MNNRSTFFIPLSRIWIVLSPVLIGIRRRRAESRSLRSMRVNKKELSYWMIPFVEEMTGRRFMRLIGIGITLKRGIFGGLHLAKDALSGKNGISLLFSTVYVRNHSRWTANGGFRSKREIQREHLLIDWLLSRFISPKSWWITGISVKHVPDISNSWVRTGLLNRKKTGWKIPKTMVCSETICTNSYSGYKVPSGTT